MAEWWKDLKDGEPRIFGFLHIDIVGSSRLPGPNALLMRTKANLLNYLSGVNSIYDVMPLSWAGDGGVFALLIDKPESYDLLTQCALHLFETVAFFNKTKGISNFAESPISVRVVCHSGEAVFNRNGSLFHGSELNAISKNEREIGIPNSVVLTEAVYNQLTSEALRGAFSLLSKRWVYAAEGQSKSICLYVYPKPSSEKEKSSPTNINPMKLQWGEMVSLVARAFSKPGSRVKTNTMIEGIEVDVLLETQSGPSRTATIVECKAYHGPVGVAAIREFYGKFKLLQGKYVQHGIMVSTNGFTDQAKVIAGSAGLQVTTFDELVKNFGGIDALPELRPETRAKPEGHFRRAFVLMPFKKDLYDVYHFGIRQPLERHGYVVERADEMAFVGGIVEKIKESIENADIIIAEMTDVNPNVYYEVGLAHALKKTVILITRSVENLPFDLRGMRFLVYETVRDLVEKLSKLIRGLS